MNNHTFKSYWNLVWLFAVFIQLSACSQEMVEQQGNSSNISSTQAVVAVAQAEPAPTKKIPARNGGMVKSVNMAAGYSYIEVDVDGDTFWLATAVTPVKPGDSIVWRDYAMMSNFTSKSLGKVFDQILFVDKILQKSDLADRSHSGTVIESMNGAGYSYIQVEEQNNRIWLAAPETVIRVGQTIRWNSGSPMRNFTSQSLKRSFDEIFFVSAIHTS